MYPAQTCAACLAVLMKVGAITREQYEEAKAITLDVKYAGMNFEGFMALMEEE